ncbi:AAA family ATPase [Duganella violaceipulchra]|uniref:AAA family ATPase n=1 Tax=Duganella violaceipulchra TaxID=2849652 RepID=A0AA41L1U6_9BURK|nr:bifunctional aminoglycoside phosphotransferase/ATP-binding protein [Duganella violaceicalia]MBV6319389.1 AAA family ATPase [Duganella violaceicalia]MCP2006799.1 aminoglycoside phosphotransferase family enzyme/predicted kinase [Duganella violaceicalia]
MACSPPPSGADVTGALERQRALLQLLEAAWERGGCRFQRFETHISWVYVLDQLAYKFKKALRLDVLDYTTLAARHHCCLEELRLNRRLAPGLYLGVSAVTGSAEQPELDGGGAALEFAVRMRAFPQQALWSARLDAGQLQAGEVDALALQLARFHAGAAGAAPDAPWGSAGALDRLGRGDLATVSGLLRGRRARGLLAALARWHAAQMAAPHAFEQRRMAGHIRECHGDLHGGNILSWEGRVEVFDAIEFNDGLRWIDVISDVAFIVMDLRHHRRDDLAARLLQGYLAASDDYQGLAVLGYYLAMRALVRCKVCLWAANGAAPATARKARASARRYLAQAVRGLTQRGALVLMHGCSGSGKSVCAALLSGPLGAICLRSDVERKRLHGLTAATCMAAPAGQGIYDEASGEATYARLLALARAVAASGLTVIVDAAHLLYRQRQPFQQLARELAIPFFIVDLHAAAPLLRERLAQRAAGGADASDAGPELLAYQQAALEPLTPDELGHALPLDSGADDLAPRIAALVATIRAGKR